MGLPTGGASLALTCAVSSLRAQGWPAGLGLGIWFPPCCRIWNVVSEHPWRVGLHTLVSRPPQPSKDTFPTRGHRSWGWAGNLSRTSEPLLRVEGPGSPWGPLLSAGVFCFLKAGRHSGPGPPPQGRMRAWSVLLCFHTCPIVVGAWLAGGCS